MLPETVFVLYCSDTKIAKSRFDAFNENVI